MNLGPRDPHLTHEIVQSVFFGAWIHSSVVCGIRLCGWAGQQPIPFQGHIAFHSVSALCCHSPFTAKRHLGCLKTGAVKNKAATDILGCASWQTYDLWLLSACVPGLSPRTQDVQL